MAFRDYNREEDYHYMYAQVSNVSQTDISNQQCLFSFCFTKKDVCWRIQTAFFGVRHFNFSHKNIGSQRFSEKADDYKARASIISTR